MTMTDPETVVATFIAAIEAKDIDAAIELLADDVSYENVPMSPIVGKDAVREKLGAFLGAATQVEWPISRQVVAGIGKSYAPEELAGKSVVIVANLKPAKLMGIESQGMLLAASSGELLAVATFDRETKTGSKVK
jgi:hypothetical protein